MQLRRIYNNIAVSIANSMPEAVDDGSSVRITSLPSRLLVCDDGVCSSIFSLLCALTYCQLIMQVRSRIIGGIYGVYVTTEDF